MRKIAVISDTHNLLRPEVLSILEGCEAILHAGDISTPEIYDRLQNISTIYAVRGNNDRNWAREIPLVLQFELYGLQICMTHIKKKYPEGSQRRSRHLWTQPPLLLLQGKGYCVS